VSPHKVAVLDLETNRTKTFSAISAALDGDRLVVATRITSSANQDATIQEVDLATGSRQIVEPDVQMYDGWKVFVHGSIVGWQAIGSPQQHYEPMSQYRNMATLDPVVTLPLDELLWSFTDAGMLTETYARGGLNPGRFPYDRLGDVPTEVFLLRPYGSTDPQKVLSGHFLHSPPQIADGVIAWIDSHGRVKAHHLG
jgi:hypothetical protein